MSRTMQYTQITTACPCPQSSFTDQAIMHLSFHHSIILLFIYYPRLILPSFSTQNPFRPFSFPAPNLQPAIQNINNIMSRPRAPIPARLLHDIRHLDLIGDAALDEVENHALGCVPGDVAVELRSKH